jgi:5-methyltetrahydrofolate--homocysteine methyltransferase
MIQAGLDSAILDPTAPGMMPAVLAAEAIAGMDEFCMNYVMAMK